MPQDSYFKSYLAGLWDGEGSFMLCKIKRRSHGEPSPNETPNYEPVAQICMTINGRQEKVLMVLKEIYGGCLFEIKDPPSKNKNGKPVLMWRATARKAGRLAQDLLPHLRMKNRQAEIIIRFCELRMENRRGGSRWCDPNSQAPEREALVKEIKALNQRGKVPR